jgi:hypothetical protein
MSPEREYAQATNLARATKAGRAAARRLVDARGHAQTLPLDDPRLPVLKEVQRAALRRQGRGRRGLRREAAPTTYLQAAFYWDNFIYFGAGPRPTEEGDLVLALPLGGIALPGIAAEDIGKCALRHLQAGDGPSAAASASPARS